MEHKIMFGLFIVGVGIALGGVVRFFITDEFWLPVLLLGSGAFLSLQTWGTVKGRFGLGG